MSDEALIVIDLQNDFCGGGALAVPGGEDIVPLVNTMIGESEHVVLTQDWHPAGHSSFASSHEGRSAYDLVQMSYGTQTLWPAHCVQGSKGAAFHPDLDWTKAELVIRKGFRPAIDSYSAFFENDRTTPTGLAGYLRERGLSSLTLCGLATDFCVAFSAIDAVKQGFSVKVRLDACRGIDFQGSMAFMMDEMRGGGVMLA
jgi:nicotinamidase/pyrazinamidase